MRVPVVVYCTIFIGEHIFVRDCGSSQKMLMGQARALAWHYGSKRSQHSLCSARCSVKMDRYIFRLGTCFTICNRHLYIMQIRPISLHRYLYSWGSMKDIICHHDIKLKTCPKLMHVPTAERLFPLILSEKYLQGSLVL